MKKSIIAILALNLLLFVGCSGDNNVKDLPVEVPQGVAVGEPNGENPDGDAMDPAAGIVLAGADEAKKIDVTTIKSIELFDIEGNVVEKTFTEDEMASIGNAYNDSMIDDISYIEMISGYNMEITLDNAQTIHITSYGDESHVVATTNGTTYHLICPEIGKLLLTEIAQ